MTLNKRLSCKWQPDTKLNNQAKLLWLATELVLLGSRGTDLFDATLYQACSAVTADASNV